MLIRDSEHTLQAGLRGWLSRTLFVAFLAVSASSCGDSVAPTDGSSPVRVDVDWSACGERVPSGMTLLFHHQTDGSASSVVDNNVDHATTSLAPGRYWATVFNLTEGEFDNIRFRGLGAADTAEAYLREAAPSKWYAAAPGDGGYVAGQPEWLAADTILTAAVMSPVSGAANTGLQVAGTLRPKNLTLRLHLLIHAGNPDNLRSARAALGGLAAGRRLAADKPNDDAVTAIHLIESDGWKRRASSPGNDIVEAVITCFGLPANHTGLPEENFLVFQALLADGKTVSNYRIPVGHLIRRIPGKTSGATDLSLEVSLDPPLPPPATADSGGIDVWFDDWDESLDFNVTL